MPLTVQPDPALLDRHAAREEAHRQRLAALPPAARALFARWEPAVGMWGRHGKYADELGARDRFAADVQMAFAAAQAEVEQLKAALTALAGRAGEAPAKAAGPVIQGSGV